MKSKGKTSTFKRITKRQFFEGVLIRLENDVGSYIDSVEKANKFVGFWALIRMLFPIIETLANTIYKGTKWKRRNRVLTSLGVQYPNLVWEIYRHSLIHGDELRVARYRGKVVTWEVRIGGNHTFSSGHIGIDMKQVYCDLVDFLKIEIERAKSSRIFIEDGIKFGREIRPQLKEEFTKIFKE